MTFDPSDFDAACADASMHVLRLDLPRGAQLHLHLGPPPAALAPPALAPAVALRRRSVLPALLMATVAVAAAFGAGRVTGSPAPLRPALAVANAVPPLQRIPAIPATPGWQPGPLAAGLGDDPAPLPARPMPADPLAAIRQGLAAPPSTIPPPGTHAPGQHPFGFQN